jgi:hypothetical protein
VKIHRSHPASGYAQIPNEALRDPRLSYTARGVLAEILSRPDDWDTSADAMWTRARRERGSAAEGHRAMRAAFAELEKCGYLRRVRKRTREGRMVTELHIYDVPAGHTDDTPCDTSVPRVQMDVSAGGTDDTDGGTSVRPAQTSIVPGRADDTVTDMSAGRTSVDRHVGERAVLTNTDYGNLNTETGDEDRRSSAAPLSSKTDDNGSKNLGTSRSTPQAPLSVSNHSTGSKPKRPSGPVQADDDDDLGLVNGYRGAHRRFGADGVTAEAAAGAR